MDVVAPLLAAAAYSRAPPPLAFSMLQWAKKD